MTKPNKCGSKFRKQGMKKLFSEAENMVLNIIPMAKHLIDPPPRIT